MYPWSALRTIRSRIPEQPLEKRSGMLCTSRLHWPVRGLRLEFQARYESLTRTLLPQSNRFSYTLGESERRHPPSYFLCMGVIPSL